MKEKKKDKKKRSFKQFIISEDFAILVFAVRVFWYIALIGVGTYYIICNWDNITTINIFEVLTGDILVFIVWLLLLIIPFIKGFEMFGFKLDIAENPINKISEKASKDVVAEVANESFKDVKKETEDALKQLLEERGGE